VLGDNATLIAPVPPPPPPSAIPANPEVAVIAVGDPLLAAPLEDELASALQDQGIAVVGGSPALEDLRRHRSSEPSVSDILSSLRGDGVHAVVIAQVERLADRELQYYGRKDVVSTSRVRIYAYLVNGRGSLGSGWSDQIEYNAVNAASEGQGAARRAVSGLAGAVRSGWSTLLGSAVANP
jgi:eukaryotic-like serine/threonine-protein kinase